MSNLRKLSIKDPFIAFSCLLSQTSRINYLKNNTDISTYLHAIMQNFPTKKLILTSVPIFLQTN